MNNQTNQKTALIFTGQGNATPLMGKDIYDNSSVAKDIFNIGSTILEKDLCKICFELPAEELSLTINAQPAIVAVSLAIFFTLREKSQDFSAVLGHSLGEYSALAAAGVVSVEDTFKLIKHRSVAMQNCAEKSGGGMCAILSKDLELINAVCEEADGFVTPVNYNSLAQTVVAGEKSAVDEVVAICKGKKIKAIPLAVNAAFHSKLMQGAADEFLANIKGENITFNTSNIDFYSNITGAKLTDFSDVPAYLAKHIVSPVMFVDQLKNLKANGYDRFIEIGPGKTISGLVKKTLSEVIVSNLETSEDIAGLLAD